MKSFYLLVILILSVSTQSFGKIIPKEKQQQLLENGITIIDNTKTYSEHQYYLLSSFDFNDYRNYTTKRLVQIEDGPLIELASLTEMQNAGKSVPSEFIANKKNELVSPNLKQVITLVNIGFKYPPAMNTETGY